MNKLIVRKAKTIRKIIVEKPITINDLLLDMMIQIYECRIFGLCVYRTEASYKKQKNENLEEMKPKPMTGDNVTEYTYY